jgi:exo-beta-1,3-glucanase (GH17 family)
MKTKSLLKRKKLLTQLAAFLLLVVMATSCQTQPNNRTEIVASSTPESNSLTSPLPTAEITITPTNVPTLTPTFTPKSIPLITTEWIERVTRIVWIAYSPPSSDPNRGIEATSDAIRDDLSTLRQANFTGLITYGSSGIMGREFPSLAESLGFEGIIMGIWDPFNEEEIQNAQRASDLPITLGYCVGNEGLHIRYETIDLVSVMENLRKTTGKPVATTEEVDDYSDETLLDLGDWVFPNVHPYFHSQTEPMLAVRWTKGAFDDFKRKTNRFILFKEVGLPTSGGVDGQLSEANQDLYYDELAKTDVHFVYFEAFDQPWKTHLPIEPHWGVFHSDRSPKLLGWHLMGLEPTPTPLPNLAFYIYQNVDSPENHYHPSGYMGDTGDIHIDTAFEDPTNSNQTVIKVVYDAEGKAYNDCSYSPPCKWAGVYWQEPPNNGGKNPEWEGKGFNLTGYTRLVFRAKADKASTIEFMVGGINQTYGDSLTYARKKTAKLTQQWQEFEIDLKDADLSHIIGGFGWVTNWERNPRGVTFYLDEIRFEK